MCEHKNMGDYSCHDCGATVDDLNFAYLREQLAAANARIKRMEPVVEAAKEYTIVCNEIFSVVGDVPGGLLDLARRKRVYISEALGRLEEKP